MNKVTDEQIQKVLIQTGGMISPAAHQLDVTRNAVYKRIRDNPDLRDALEEIRESLIDYAEGQLQRKIREGHPSCIMFYLRTMGKSRGYVERQELSGKDGKDLVPQKSLNLPPLPATYAEWQQQRVVNPLLPEVAEAEHREVESDD
jgi:GTP cyclohydrolase II